MFASIIQSIKYELEIGIRGKGHCVSFMCLSLYYYLIMNPLSSEKCIPTSPSLT